MKKKCETMNGKQVEHSSDAFLLVLVPIGGLLLLLLFYYCLKVAQAYSHVPDPSSSIFWSARALWFHQKWKGETDLRTNRRTDRPFYTVASSHLKTALFRDFNSCVTNRHKGRQMDSYRDVRMHLKIPSKEITSIFARQNWEGLTDLRTKGPTVQWTNRPTLI